MSEKKSSHWHHAKSGAAITVRLGPNARESQIANILEDGTLFVRLAKSDSEPDRELIRFLADVLKVKMGQIEIVAGLGGKDKLIAIDDLSPDAVEERIEQFRQL